MSAIGRKLTFKSGHFRVSERPVWVKADIQPGRMAAFHPKAVIGLEWVCTTANDPKRIAQSIWYRTAFFQKGVVAPDAAKDEHGEVNMH